MRLSQGRRLVSGVVLVAVAAVFYAWASVASSPTDGRRQVELLPERIDFGKRTSGDKLELNLQVANHGDVPARVQRVRTSCGCLVGRMSEGPIKPGGHGRLKVQVDGLGRVGDFYGYVFLEMEDGRFVHPAEIRGTFKPDVTGLVADPAVVQAGVMRPGGISYQVLMLRSAAGEGIQEIHVSCTEDHVSAVIDPVNGDRTTRRMVVWVRAPATAATIDAELVVTADGIPRATRIPVHAIVTPPVEVRPKNVLVLGGTETVRLTLDSGAERCPALVSHTFKSEGLRLTKCVFRPGTPPEVLVSVSRETDHTGFADGYLTLSFERCDTQAQAVFVAAPLSR